MGPLFWIGYASGTACGLWVLNKLMRKDDTMKKRLPPVTVEEQRATEAGLRRQLPAKNFVAPERMTVLPSHHEVTDPYAMAPALDTTQMVSHHHYRPIDRAWAMVAKTSTATVFLALMTAAAMMLLSGWAFFWWLFLASLEWVVVFCLLAVLDWRETPAAQTFHKMNIYASLMETEQRARLWALYGWKEDEQ